MGLVWAGKMHQEGVSQFVLASLYWFSFSYFFSPAGLLVLKHRFAARAAAPAHLFTTNTC